MTRAVDLAAFARARTALRALVDAHPQLTSPAAQARAARWLTDTDLEVNMARKPLSEDSDTVQLAIKLSRALRDALDREVDRLRAQVPEALRGMVTISKAEVVRRILETALLAAPAAAPAPTSAPRQPDLFAARPVPTNAPVVAPVAPLALVTGPDLEARVLAALRALTRDHGPVVFIQDLVRVLPDLVPADMRRALLALSESGHIELRPWSGVDALPESERARCPADDEGFPLAAFRVLPAAPAAAPAIPHAVSAAPAAPDLRARFNAGAAADPERVTRRAAYEAIGVSEPTFRRWLKSAGALPADAAEKLAAWLTELGQ